jgi:hypothetical protein
VPGAVEQLDAVLAASFGSDAVVCSWFNIVIVGLWGVLFGIIHLMHDYSSSEVEKKLVALSIEDDTMTRRRRYKNIMVVLTAVVHSSNNTHTHRSSQELQASMTALPDVCPYRVDVIICCISLSHVPGQCFLKSCLTNRMRIEKYTCLSMNNSL